MPAELAIYLIAKVHPVSDILLTLTFIALLFAMPNTLGGALCVFVKVHATLYSLSVAVPVITPISVIL